MTREEAIQALKKEKRTALHENKSAFDIAIKVLEQEPCEDCISRKALLEEIENGIKAGNCEEGYEEYPHINDMDDIIECIKYADSIQPTTKENLVVGDCISRAEVINAISHAELSFQVESDLNFENYKREVQEIADGILKGQVKAISDLASVQPKPKTGHWIIKEGREQGYDIAGIKTWYIQIMCDKCGFIKTAIEGHTGQYHFCPNCGAKMLPTDSEKE